MITNELLNEKYESQKRLDIKSKSNLKNYVKNIHKSVENLEKSMKIKFNYVKL